MVGVRKNLFPSKSGTGNGSCNGPTMDKVEEEVQSKRTQKLRLGRLARPSFPTPAFSFSTDHILSSESRSLSISGQSKFIAEITELDLCQGTLDTSSTSEIPSLVDNLPTSSEITPCPDSPLSSFPRFMPNLGNINSLDRLTGDLLFLDCSLSFTEAELADAPAEVLGTSSHGTLNNVTLDSDHVLTAKRVRFGIFERKMDFVRGARRIGSMRHPNINPLRACYLGPWEEARILYADYIHGDNLALHLYSAITEQIGNLRALGYCAPELATASRPVPSFQANVYAFGVILMEISTGKVQQFPTSSFRPANEKLNLTNNSSMPDKIPIKGKHHSSKGNIRIAIILSSVEAVVMIVFALLAYHRAQFHERGKFTFRDVQLGRLARPSFQTPTFSISTDHILSSESRSLSISGQSKFIAEITNSGLCQGTLDTSSTAEIPSLVDNLPTSSEITPCPDSPLSSFPRFMPNLGNINSLDRLIRDLLFLDCSLSFTEAELADAPSEVLGTSSHGTLNKVTLDSGHVLTAKRLRFGIFE
ncbi:hypothetical protein RIF29_15648 [Crotalaria pallida]|uniref:Protein kinase domain-containing protein n=1 Tax=Crotalaria pallida TaxID=3830 RepID=A0AAN9ICS6_CROPI